MVRGNILTRIANRSRGYIALLRDPLYRSTLLLVLSSLANAMLGFIFWIVAARLYSAVDVGLVAALTAASGLMAMLASLGFPTALLRFLSQSDDRRAMVNSIFTTSIVLSVVFSAIFIAGTPLWSPELVFLKGRVVAFAMFTLVTAGTALSYSQSHAFIALRRPGLAFVLVFVSALLRIPLAIALARFGLVGLWVTWGLFLALNFIMFVILFRLTQPGYLPAPAFSRALLKGVLSFSVSSLLAEVPYATIVSILPLMVLNALGPEATAYYYVAFRFSSFLFSVATFAGMALLVEGSYDPGKLRQNVLKAMRFSLLILAPALLVISLIGDKLLLLFGRDYSEQALTVVWLISAASLPHIVIEFYIAVRRVQMRMLSVLTVTWAVLVMNLGIAWPALNAFGLAGSGAGWLVSYSVVAAAIVLLLARRRLVGKRAS